jgi:tetratricopeptide (TPR) repeat protein
MREESEKANGAGGRGPIVLCPWLAALAALALYGWTLNHWVTFSSLPLASQIMGWDWHPGPLSWRPNPQYPLFLILTFPLRLLPAGWRVMGLNVLTAACAALTLAILARSVRLLSHDRTEDQRRRERGEHAFLSMRTAFLPAAFAVLLLGGQLTFWDNAVSGIGDMIDVLVFAFLILCLLEYRISQGGRRLDLFAFVYGAGMANNWALIGFFPCFLLALVWIKRARFFKWGFVLRMTGWGALGLLLYGLIPLLGAAAGDGSFLDLLRQKLAEQYIFLTRMRRYYAVIAGVPTLIPLFFAAIKWPSSRDDLAAGAHSLTRGLIRLLHIVLLALGVLMFFDEGSIPTLRNFDVGSIPTPRNLGMGVMTGWPGFLSFYYLAALSVGYFSGYVLLVFGRDEISRWHRTTGIPRLINKLVVGLLWLAAIGLPAMFLHANYQRVRDFNSPAVADFGREMAKGMPSPPAVIVADQEARLYLAMGASQSLGLPDQYIFLESRSLVHGEYLRYLAARHPLLRQQFVNPDRLPDQITEQQAGDLLAQLARQGPVYYLYPGFEGCLERVGMTPHRLGVNLHPYPTNILETLALTSEAVVTNQDYWHAQERELASLPELAKRSADARRIALYYSQILDYWGVELQKMATRRKLPLLLEDANAQFAAAIRLNTNNLMALANQQYNAQLRGAPAAGAPITASMVAGQYNNRWDLALNLYGPADVPELDIEIGRYFAHRGAHLQAAPWFQRSFDLKPGDPVSELDLINTYIDLGLLDAASVLIRNLRERSAGNPLELAAVEALASIVKNNFAQADALLADARNKNPKDDKFAGLTAEFYRRMGDRILRESKGDAAREKSAEKDAAAWFQKALAALDDQLQLLNGRAAGAQELSAVNRRRADMQMTLHHYDAAIVTLTTLVSYDPADPLPLLDRAVSELEIGRLDAAREDYLAVEKMTPGPPPAAYYGLAQVAQKQNDKQAEIRYDKLYLQHAPRNTLEYSNVTAQLRALERR